MAQLRKNWVLRILVIALAVFVLGLLIYHSTIRTVIEEYAECQQTKKEIKALNPQSPEELWPALKQALRIRADHPTAFYLKGREIMDLLCKSQAADYSSGNGSYTSQYKPWATEELRNKVYNRMEEGYRAGFCSGFWPVPKWDEKAAIATQAWGNQFFFWLEAVAYLLVSTGTAIVGFMFLPYFIILFLAGLIVSGKSHSNELIPKADSKIQQTVNNIQKTKIDGDGGYDEASSFVGITCHFIWPIMLLLIGFIARYRDLRKEIRINLNRICRAPPERSFAMLRLTLTLVVIVIISLPSAVSAQDKIDISLGEWFIGRGLGATWLHDFGNPNQPDYSLKAFFQGECQEALMLKNMQLGKFAISPALLAGTFIDGGGDATFYTGAEIRGGFPVGPLNAGYRWGYRLDRNNYLNHIWRTDLTSNFRYGFLGISWQSIKCHPENYWRKRPAIIGQLDLKKFDLYWELRKQLNADQSGKKPVTMGFDIIFNI